MLFDEVIEGFLVYGGEFFQLDNVNAGLSALNFRDIRLRSLEPSSNINLLKLSLNTRLFEPAYQILMSFCIYGFIHGS